MEKELGRILGISNSQTGLDIRPADSDGEFTEPTVKRRKRNDGWQEGKKDKGPPKSKWQIVQGKVYELLEGTAICPLEGIKHLDRYINDHVLTDPDNARRVDAAIQVWSHKINKWTIRDFAEMYGKVEKSPEKIEKERKDAELLGIDYIEESDRVRDFKFSESKKYLSEQESFEIIDKLLMYQFDQDEAQVKSFLQHLINVMDWQPADNPGCNPKCNALLIYSNPNAGKNFFFDCLFQLCLSLGILGNANKQNNFAFQDAVNRRVILWNEPNYSKSHTDSLKTLFEGGDTKVRVKQVADAHITRTPIIILTNNVVDYMVEEAFLERIKQYTWKPADFLKDYKLKPWPLCFIDILLKYKIKF